MSKQSKRLLLSVSNAINSCVDEYGDLNKKGMTIAAPIIVALLLLSFWLMGEPSEY